MKATGITRKLDDLGRVVLPVEIRRTLGWGEKEPIEIFVDESSVVLKRFKPLTEVQEEVVHGMKMMMKTASPEDKEVLKSAVDLIKHH